MIDNNADDGGADAGNDGGGVAEYDHDDDEHESWIEEKADGADESTDVSCEPDGYVDYKSDDAAQLPQYYQMNDGDSEEFEDCDEIPESRCGSFLGWAADKISRLRSRFDADRLSKVEEYNQVKQEMRSLLTEAQGSN